MTISNKLKAKLEQRLAKMDRSGGNSGVDFFKPGEDETRIRILPYPFDDIPFIEMYFHYEIAGERSIVCPKELNGSRCPICELADELKASDPDNGWKLAKQFWPKMRVYSFVAIRGHEDEGPKLWGYGITVYKELMNYMTDEDWGDVTDIKSGRDFTFASLPPGKGGNTGTYNAPVLKIKPAELPLHEDKKVVKALLSAIPDVMNPAEGVRAVFEVKDYDDLVKIVARLDVEAEDDEGTVVGDSDDTTSSETKSKIDELLAETNLGD